MWLMCRDPNVIQSVLKDSLIGVTLWFVVAMPPIHQLLGNQTLPWSGCNHSCPGNYGLHYNI